MAHSEGTPFTVMDAVVALAPTSAATSGRGAATLHLARHRTWIAVGVFAASTALSPALAAGSDRASEPHSFDLSWTQFLSMAESDDADSDVRYGGRLDWIATLDGEQLGLWKGFSINAHAEGIYGENAGASGLPVLLPVNTAMTFPVSNDEAADLSINFTQKINRASLTFGKINMLDKIASTPVVGGGGQEGFQHVGLAATPSLLTPPSSLGRC